MEGDRLELSGSGDDLGLTLQLLVQLFIQQSAEAQIVSQAQQNRTHQHANRADDNNAIHRVHVHRGGGVRTHTS